MGVDSGSYNASASKGPGSDDLSSYFHKSASAVQGYTGRFEEQYARPGLKVAQEFFDERPITRTFLGISAALSFVPVMAFIGLSLFCIITFAVLALLFTVLASSAAILTLLVILGSTLLAIFFTSAFLTAMTLSSYFLLRLAILVRQDGAAGISGWAGETKDRILGVTRPPKQSDRGGELALSDSADESIVVVQEREPLYAFSDSRGVKEEDDNHAKEQG